MALLHRQWKNRLGGKFKARGGLDDMPRVRANTPKGLSFEKWNSFVDFYSTPKQQAKSKANSESRKSNTRPNCQGRSSMTQRRARNVKDVATDKPSGNAAVVWGETKRRKDGSWAHDDYEPLYNQLQAGMTQQTQQHLSESGSTSEDASTYQLPPSDQISVMQSVFKPRRDYMPGIGPVVPGGSWAAGSSSGDASSSSRPSMYEEQQREMEQMRRMMELQLQQITQLQSQHTAAEEQIRQESEARMRFFASQLIGQIPGLNISDEHLNTFFTQPPPNPNNRDPNLPPRCGDGTLEVPIKKDDNYECRNMKILLGQRHKIVLGRSDIYGWRAFLTCDVGKDEFLGEYTGEAISHYEADKRGKIYDRIKRSYLFDLNDQVALDSFGMGNKLKFANHSFNPNCYAKIMMVAGDHRVGIYTKRPIKAGEEIFYDYKYHSSVSPPWAAIEPPTTSTFKKKNNASTSKKSVVRKHAQ